MNNEIKILVVSNCETTRKAISFWLTSLFLQKNILVAENFFQAWMTLMEKQIGMVITDMIDGTELAIEMNKETKTCMIPVIFFPCLGVLTGESDITKIPMRVKSFFLHAVKICTDSMGKRKLLKGEGK